MRLTPWSCLAFSGLLLAADLNVERDHEWPYYGGDQGGSKYSSLTQINRSNVKNLKLAWQWKTGEQSLPAYGTSPGMFEVTPIMIGGVLYFSTPYNRVIALNPVTGRELWNYDPKAYEDGQVPNGTGFVHRGVAAWRDRSTNQLRILMNSRYRLIELDAKTGKPVADFGDNGVVNLLAGLPWEVNPKHYTNTSPPVVYKDLIIVGNGVADRLIYKKDPPGDVRAYNARTGKLAWTFHTVPHEGEFGSDTWEGGSNNYTGHTNVWAPMTLDEARGLLYLPVSTPSNDNYGGSRLGANLFADSLVCLDAATGQRKWHYQIVHHGLWDYDMPGPPSLVRIKVDGKPIDAVAQLTKQGFVFVFDRVTGKPVWGIEERSVPASDVAGEKAWPTQPVPLKPPPLTPQGVSPDDAFDLTPELKQEATAALKKMRTGPLFTPPSVEGTIMRPGVLGGADWGGGAFDPETGILYVKVNTNPSLIRPRIPDKDGNITATGGGGPSASGSLLIQHRIPVLKPPYAYLDAVNLNLGSMAWQTPFGDDEELRKHPALEGVKLPEKLGAVGDAGVIVTKGGLVFAGGGDTAFHAVDKSSGKDLWSYPTPGVKTNGTPMTYQWDGRQYVVIAVGGAGTDAALLAFSL
jgi:quinoprotein glucose dehydrogenase